MIVERKQYGCVTLLFVQIGLALFVIVLFLAPQANGTVRPVVLSVQKVAESRQATTQAQIEAASSHIQEQLTLSGHISDTAASTQALTSITASDRLAIEDSVVAKVVAHAEYQKTLESQDFVAIAPVQHGLAPEIQTETSSLAITSIAPVTFSIYTLGTSPRAPAIIG